MLLIVCFGMRRWSPRACVNIAQTFRLPVRDQAIHSAPGLLSNPCQAGNVDNLFVLVALVFSLLAKGAWAERFTPRNSANIFLIILKENIVELSVLDIEKFVKVNDLQPVTALTFFEATGAPTEGGLFSTSIFGRPGSEDRRRRWAYIDLNGRFLHPLIYKSLCQLDRKFPDLVAGMRRVQLSRSGQLQDVPDDIEGGWTGLDGLYEHWENITWGATEAGSQRGERVGLLKAVPRDLAFVQKWPVMPALYRDVDTSASGGIKEVPPINNLYVQVMVSSPTKISGLIFADGTRKRRAQEALLELHRSALELIAGKKGLIQERVLGKYTDWAVRGVLSGPALAKAPKPGDQEVPFGYVGIPLYLVVNMFQPFVVKRLGEIFGVYATGQERILVNKTEGEEPVYFELPADARAQLGPELYKKWISRFMRSQDNRTDVVSLKTGKGVEIPIPLYDVVLGRPTTLLDLFFIVATDVTADKYVMFTRYPVEDFRACHFAKAAILTTETTEERTIGEQRYLTYPKFEQPMRWVDSFRLNNSYTSAMGADYDGDTHRVIGLFTQEANAEAEKLIAQPTNYCDGQGAFSRKVANEAILTLYALTK
jgi:hypothetical protein